MSLSVSLSLSLSNTLTHTHSHIHTRHSQLADRGADVNAQEADGWTPLHFCAFHGSIECVDLLLSLKANAALFDLDGRSAAGVALYRGHAQVCVCVCIYIYLPTIPSNDLPNYLPN